MSKQATESFPGNPSLAATQNWDVTEKPASPKTRRFLWVFSITMVLVAGTAFVFKLIEFYSTATQQGADALASFLIPVLNYLLVAAGFFFLFLWAYITGQFRDVERPKYRMLEIEAEIEHQERLSRRGA